MTQEQSLSTGPWTVECVEHGQSLSGRNWVIADLGEDHEGRKWFITTDRVPASELLCEPEADARAIVEWRNGLLRSTPKQLDPSSWSTEELWKLADRMGAELMKRGQLRRSAGALQ